MILLAQGFLAGACTAIALLAAALLMALAVRWARRHSRGAVIAGAMLSLFAPDPELERNLRLADRARQVQSEEDEEGEGDHPAGSDGAGR